MKIVNAYTIPVLVLTSLVSACGGGGSNSNNTQPQETSGENPNEVSQGDNDNEAGESNCEFVSPIASGIGGRSTLYFNGWTITDSETSEFGRPSVTTSYTYDLSVSNEGTITSTNFNLNGIATEISTFELDSARRPVSEIYQDVWSTPIRSNRRTFLYEQDGLLSTMTFENTDDLAPGGEDGGGETASLTFDYHPILRTTQKIELISDEELVFSRAFEWECTTLQKIVTTYPVSDGEDDISTVNVSYSEASRTLETVEVNNSGLELKRVRFVFDENGNLLKEEKYDETGGLYEETVSRYNTGFIDVINMPLIGYRLRLGTF